MTGGTRRTLWLLLLPFAAASCLPQPAIVEPADGSVAAVAPAGAGVPVHIALGSGFGDESALRVTLVAGIDSPPGSITEITSALSVAGDEASGEIDPALLAPGRNSLFVTISTDGDAIPETILTSSFSWEPALDLSTADRCDPLDPAVCLYPFPNDHFTREDAASDTGRRVDLAAESMPRNLAGDTVDPTEWNRNDGFSPGQALQVMVPGLVLQTPSGDPAAPPIPAPGHSPQWNLAASLDPAANIVILDSETGERVPHWAELNARVDASLGQLLIRPAVNFASGRHYVVALRNLRDGSGELIPPSRAFALYRDATPTFAPEIEARRAHMEATFATLERHGVPRDDLYLAWDFTVISKRNMSERLLHMRDDAFAQLGSAAPNFEITNVDVRDADPEILWRVDGRVEVPNYLNNRAETFIVPGGAVPPARRQTRLYCEDETGQPRYCEGDELPRQARLRCESAPGVEKPCDAGDEPVDAPTYWADFRCTVPASALAADGSAVPARASLYGHGLLGSQGEASASHVEDMAFEHGFVFCGARWIGMGNDDLASVVAILNDFGRFPTLADRLHQAMLNFLFLGRLMIHPDGLGSHEAFQAADGTSLIDGSDLFYDGNSQGAIAGGALAAFAQDYTRAVLGVPGMNYSTLLFRSVDFNQFLVILQGTYPDRTRHPLLIGLAQMLWDRAEANGHANHLTRDPYAGTPAKKILLHVAFGDFQVADVSAEVQARTLGASMHRAGFDPAAYADQNPSGDPRPFWPVDPYWNIPGIPDGDPGPAVPGVTSPDYRFDGSALVVWDSGNLQAPNANQTPGGGNPELSTCAASFGGDPHECPRRQPLARIQKSEFLKTDGAVIDVCEETRAGFPAGLADVCLAPLRP